MYNNWRIVISDNNKGYELALKYYKSNCDMHERYKKEGNNRYSISLDDDDIFKFLSLENKDNLFRKIKKGHVQKLHYYIDDTYKYIRAILLVNHSNKDYTLYVCEYGYV